MRVLPSLRARLLLLVQLTLLPALLLILYTGVEQRRLAVAAAQGDTMHVVQLAAGTHKELFAETQRLVQLLAQLPAVREGSAASCSAFLTHIFKQDSTPRYSSLFAIRPNGDVFCSSVPLKRRINAGDQAYYRRVMNSRAFAIGDYQIGRITGRAIIVLAQPVLDAAGEVQAIVGAGIDLGWLNRLAAEAKLPDGSTLTMIDQNGIVLVRYPGPDKWLGSSTANTPLFKIVRARGDGAIQAPGMDGVERLHAFTALRDAGGSTQAHISVGIPTATAFVEANQILARNLVVLALVTALALATAWYGGNIFLLRQIGTLVGAARRLGRGDLSTRTGLPHQSGEIGDLARSFDEMAEGLQARVAEVRRAEAEIRKLAGVTEQTDDSVVITDSEGVIEYVNPAYERGTGYRREEALGKKPNIVKSGKHGEGFYRTLWQTIRAGKVFRDVFVNRRKDGTLYYEEKTITPLKNERGEITHFVSTGKDINERMRAEQTLRESESRLAHAQHLARLGNWDWNLDSGELHWSEETFRIFGLDPRTAVPTAEDFLKAVHTDDRERVSAAAHRAIDDGVPFSIEFRIIRPDGAERIVHEEAEIVRDKTGKAVRMLGTTQDITERKQTEDLLARLGRILDDSSNEIYVFCAESLRFVQVNRGAQRNLGYTMDELKSLTPLDFKPEFTRESFEALIAPLRRGEKERLSFTTVHRRKDGSNYPVEVQLQFMRLETPPVFVAIIQDITERRAAEERLSYLAYHDTLTDLPNRVLLLERLQQAMVDAERVNRLVAVMFLDLDRFKVINDTLGHHVGDALLKAVAGRLQTCVRPGDIVARLGGDEFTVVLANVAHVDDVARVARKILNSFAQPFRVEDQDLFTTTSIGITLFPLDVQEPEKLLKNADAAMYHAKESGRNAFQFFTTELNQRAERRLKLETALRRALEREELSLHYQPQVDTKTGRITGMEALLRWRNPELGNVSPVEFIPIAEETGLILPVGYWVLREACRQTKTWHDTGFPPMQIAVNLSSKQLLQKDFTDQVRGILQEANLAARYLDLELTESLLMTDAEGILDTLHTLHDMGVSFSVDDFGTGYSSLSYLKRFPIDILKIDQSFVRDIASDPNDVAIVRTIIAMAHTLGMRVIAEGVETYEQLVFLRDQGCDGSQGYYCSKPLAANDFTELLADWERIHQGKCQRAATKRKPRTPARGQPRPAKK